MLMALLSSTANAQGDMRIKFSGPVLFSSAAASGQPGDTRGKVSGSIQMSTNSFLVGDGSTLRGIPSTASISGVYMPKSAGSSNPFQGNVFFNAGNSLAIGFDQPAFCNDFYTTACEYFSAVRGGFLFTNTSGIELALLSAVNADSSFSTSLCVGCTATLFPGSIRMQVQGIGDTSATATQAWSNLSSTKLSALIDNGNWGFGTTTPGSVLSVVGDSMFTGPSTFMSSMTFQSSTFTIGGSSFVVVGGSVTIAYRLQASSAVFTSPLAVPSGGTGVNTIPTNGIVYGNGSSAVNNIVMGKSHLLGSNGSNAPTDYDLVGTANQVLVTKNASDFTLSGPQNLGTGNSPSFAGLTVTGQVTTTSTMTVIGNAFSVGNSTFSVASGSVTIGGQLHLGGGYTTNSCAAATTCTATCPANTRATGCGNCTIPSVGGLAVGTGGSSDIVSCTCTSLVADNLVSGVYCARILP